MFLDEGFMVLVINYVDIKSIGILVYEIKLLVEVVWEGNIGVV